MAMKKVIAISAVALSGLAVAGDAKMPIIGWGTGGVEGAGLERFYQEAKDGGFTHLIQWCRTPAAAKCALSLAEKAGIRLIVGFAAHGWTNGLKRMTDEAEALVSAVRDSPVLDSYYVTDEPHVRMAGAIRDCVKRYEALDPSHPCYVNLYGGIIDTAVRADVEKQRKLTGCATYGEYVRSLYDVVPLKMISFDMYPVLSYKPHADGDFRLHGEKVFLKERWYETLEIVSAFARERRIPMFAFALATAHRNHPEHAYPVPTLAHLRLQHYSNLAYGAQALQYFRSQRRSYSTFELIRELNKELQARAYVFAGCEVVGVWHTGKDVPIGTKRLAEGCLPPFVKSFEAPNGGTAVVSWLRNGGTDYLMVVNRDTNDDIMIKATFADGTEIVRRDGTKVSAAACADYFWLDPGDAAIFAFANVENP